MIVLLALGVSFVYANKTGEEKTQVRIVPNVKADKYSLVYVSENNHAVRVNIYNQSGKLIHRDYISDTRFWKTYNFSLLTPGTYTVRINNGEDTFEKTIEHRNLPLKKLKIDVKELGSSKYELAVLGVDELVKVSILNKNGEVIHYDEISVLEDFKRVYDLSKLNTSEVTFIVEKKDQKQTKHI